MQENTKTTNGNHDVVDGRHNGQEMLEKLQNGKTPNNNSNNNSNSNNNNNNGSYSSLPPDMSGAVLSRAERGEAEQADKDQQAETAETEERRRTAHRVFSKQG